MECPTYRCSVSRTGFAEVNGTRKTDLLWVKSMNASITSSPVVANEMLYVTTMNGKIYALDLKTGDEIWVFNANSPISSTPSVDGGIVIFGTEKPGKIYALNAYTGLVRWLYEIPETAGVCSSPAIFEEKVVIGSSDGYLYCLSQFEGELLWVNYVGGGKLSSPAIADNTIFITSPHIYAVNFSTGSLIWRYTTNWPVYSSPAVADGLVFVGAENDDKVFAFEQKTGKLVWSFQTSGWLTSPAIDSYKKLVVAGCRDTRVYCLSEFTGFLKWQFINAPNYLSAPTISKDGLVYVGSTDGNLYCLNEETGKEIWKYNVGSPIVSSPTIIYQHVIVASEEGKLFCFGPSFPTHNIAVSNAKASPSKIREGERLEVNFTIENCGDSEEKITITISLNCSNKLIKQFANFGDITALPGENLTYTLYLNSTDIPPGYCNIIIEAHTVPDETDFSDNAYSTDIITIIALIDIDADGEINITDIYKLAAAYGTEPGHPRWNPDADVNKDDIIDIFDVFLISKKFGKKYL
jgi:outer membrane protein assembly factor BamB